MSYLTLPYLTLHYHTIPYILPYLTLHLTLPYLKSYLTLLNENEGTKVSCTRSVHCDTTIHMVIFHLVVMENRVILPSIDYSLPITSSTCKFQFQK